jgi:hypothetical protein
MQVDVSMVVNMLHFGQRVNGCNNESDFLL